MQTSLFKSVIHIGTRTSIAHDAHSQRCEEIAVYKENNFWQPPSEAWEWDECVSGENNLTWQTSRSSRSDYKLCNYQQIEIACNVPPCPEWWRDHTAAASNGHPGVSAKASFALKWLRTRDPTDSQTWSNVVIVRQLGTTHGSSSYLPEWNWSIK